MSRLLVILAVLVVCCNAGSIGYSNQSPKKLESLLPPASRNEFIKSFYFFADPDDEDVSSYKYTTPEIKKNVQVVVIKAPEYNGYTKAALDLARQAVETKNLIYVLSKQPDIVDLHRRFDEISSRGISKPEVRFIKYRTPDEAKSAQKTIRTLLSKDHLQSDSNSLDFTVAPVLDKVESSSSVLKDDDSDEDYDELFTARKPPFLPKGIDVVPGSSYLPPKRD